MEKSKQPRQPTAQNQDGALARALRLANGGAKHVPTSNSEAWGMGVQKYLFPLLSQGIQTWIDNYKDRGRRNNEIIDKVRKHGIGSLTPEELEQFNSIKHRYGDEFNQPAPSIENPESSLWTQRAAQEALLGRVPENGYFPPPNQDFGAALEVNARAELDDRLSGGLGSLLKDTKPPDYDFSSAFTGENLAKFGQDLIQSAGQNSELDELLKDGTPRNYDFSSAFTGENLAKFGQENADALIQNLGRNPQLDELLRLKPLFGGGF